MIANAVIMLPENTSNLNKRYHDTEYGCTQYDDNVFIFNLKINQIIPHLDYFLRAHHAYHQQTPVAIFALFSGCLKIARLCHAWFVPSQTTL